MRVNERTNCVPSCKRLLESLKVVNVSVVTFGMFSGSFPARGWKRQVFVTCCQENKNEGSDAPSESSRVSLPSIESRFF